jgi:hypothetical protein
VNRGQNVVRSEIHVIHKRLTAASVVTAQLPYVPTRTAQYAAFFVSGFRFKGLPKKP